MERLTATVARAHLNNAAWLVETTTENPAVEGTRVALALAEIQKDFEGITVHLGAERYQEALLALRSTVVGWEGHDYGLDALRSALTAYGDAMEADAIPTTAREELAKQLNLMLIKAVEIAKHSS